MVENNCYTIAIAGGSGAGKTELVTKLHEKLSNSSMLLYDDYSADYSEFIRDIRLMKKGKRIKNSKKDEVTIPCTYLIVEDPAGITNFDSKELINFMVYIDTPLEVSLARIMLRAIFESTDEGIESFYSQIGQQHQFSYKEPPTKLMHVLVWVLKNYLKTHRLQYINDREKQLTKANFIVDGTKPTETIAKEVINWLADETMSKS